VERIVAVSPGSDVVDVGCGTGIVARQLQALGCRVVGVEPDARMAEFARGSGVDTEVATFEVWEPAGRVFDAVVAGQTWHWVDPVAGAVKAAQVLRPGGQLIVFWNVERPRPQLAEAFAAVYRQIMPDSLAAGLWTAHSSDAYLMLCAKAADGVRQAGGFDEPQQWDCLWEQTYSRDEWLDQVPTQGDHSQFPPATLQQLLAGIGTAIDAVGGSFTMTYATVAVTAARASDIGD
jgi:SAM-dependent methyltransferase